MRRFSKGETQSCKIRKKKENSKYERYKFGYVYPRRLVVRVDNITFVIIYGNGGQGESYNQADYTSHISPHGKR